MIEAILENIYKNTNFSFEKTALDVFRYQYTNNLVYRQFVDLLKIHPENVKTILQIPFLPIEFFKTHTLLNTNVEVQKIFESSGTTSTVNSKHYVADLELYKQNSVLAFEHFYGNLEEWTILALLPSYLERDNSSLVYMADEFIRLSQSADSGFYLHNLDALADKLHQLQSGQKKVLLMGVTFALLDFAEKFPMDLSGVTIMETGGMKGRREELSRTEVHSILTKAFHTQNIHSEYGMTELLSQAYSKGNGIFASPPSMKILKRDLYAPLNVSFEVGRGGLNVIDLANMHSCSFIATEDMVRLLENDEFEVLGRIDFAEIRGCNMLLNDISAS